jgi:hypothetical protein
VKKIGIIDMIKKFENFREIDPLGEEDWDDDKLNLIKIDRNTVLKKGDEIWVNWTIDENDNKINKFYGFINARIHDDEYIIRRFDGCLFRKNIKDLEKFAYNLRIKTNG